MRSHNLARYMQSLDRGPLHYPPGIDTKRNTSLLSPLKSQQIHFRIITRHMHTVTDFHMHALLVGNRDLLNIGTRIRELQTIE